MIVAIPLVAHAQDSEKALAPSNLSADLVDNKVTLTWDAPSEDAASVTGYRILRRQPNNGEYSLSTLVADTASTVTTYADESANEAGERYVYRVKALRGSETSARSNRTIIDLPADYDPDGSGSEEPEPTSAPTPTPEPDADPASSLAPSGLTATLLVSTAEDEDDLVSLFWTAPAADADSVTGYEILRSQGDGELSSLVADTGSKATSYTDATATEAGATYTYRVKALRGDDESIPSESAQVQMPEDGDASGDNTITFVEGDPYRPDIQPQDTTVTLVSNTGQAADESATWPRDRAQRFTTGPNSTGYTLSTIEIISEDTEGDDAAVAVWTVGSDGFPNSLHASLTAPGSFSAGTLVFTAPTNTTLVASTTYTVLVRSPGGQSLTLKTTDSNEEDAGGATGWTISDAYDFKNAGNFWDSTSSNESIRIAVKGVMVSGGEMTGGTTPPVEPCDATWCATMTVGEFADSVSEYAGYDDGSSTGIAFGSLTPTSVVIGGVTHTVYALQYQDSFEEMVLIVKPALPDDFVLEIGSDSFASSDAYSASTNSNGTQTVVWDEPDPGWSDGDSVEVKLLVAADDTTPPPTEFGTPVIKSVTLLGNGEAKVLWGPVGGNKPGYNLLLKYRGELKPVGGQTLPKLTLKILDKDDPANDDDPYFRGEVGGLSPTFREYCFVVWATQYIPPTTKFVAGDEVIDKPGYYESRLSEESCVSNPNHDSAPPAAAPGQPQLSYYVGRNSLSVEIINENFDLLAVDKAVSYELSYLHDAEAETWVTLPDGAVNVSFGEYDSANNEGHMGAELYRYWANVLHLPDQDEYSIRVRAVNPNGESDWSEARQITRRQ